MGKLKEMKLYGTTSALGALTVNGTQAVFGRLFAVRWIDGGFANGVDAVISTQTHEAAATLLTLTDANDDATYYPKEAVCDNTGAALTVSQDSVTHDLPIMVGIPRMVVSSGGATAEGGCVLFYFED